jgi:hypothetical protein
MSRNRKKPNSPQEPADDDAAKWLAPFPPLRNPFVRWIAIVDAAGVMSCIISRAPTLLHEIELPVLGKIPLNAGYLLVGGPLAILLAAALFWYLASRAPAGGTWTAADIRVSAVLFAFPVLCAAFLSLQFFLLLAPPGACPSFDRWRYLTDFALGAFQPEYCMGLPQETQRGMPWLLEPPILQGWLQLLLPVGTALLMRAAWRAWAPRVARDRGGPAHGTAG